MQYLEGITAWVRNVSVKVLHHCPGGLFDFLPVPFSVKGIENILHKAFSKIKPDKFKTENRTD